MIIKKRNLRGKVEKVEPKKVEARIPDAQISEIENIEQQPVVEEVVQEISQPEVSQEPEIDLFDIENIDFTQRQERRRGSRRRGYRRIDDRNLVSRAQEEAENIKKSAFEEGYRKGMEQASADMEAFRNSFSEFMNAPKNVFEYIAPDILEISVDVAKKIIKKEVTIKDNVLMCSIDDVKYSDAYYVVFYVISNDTLYLTEERADLVGLDIVDYATNREEYDLTIDEVLALYSLMLESDNSSEEN